MIEIPECDGACGADGHHTRSCLEAWVNMLWDRVQRLEQGLGMERHNRIMGDVR